MNFTLQRGLRLRLLAAACQHTCLCELLAERPKPAQKAVRALDARARPFERRVGRRGENRKQAHCIGAVLVNQCLRIDAIIFDFDIFSMPPASTGWPSAFSVAPRSRPLSSKMGVTSAGLNHCR